MRASGLSKYDITAPAAMELFDASSPGRRGGQDCGQSSIKELLQQVYSTHVGVAQGLQKQISSLTSLVAEKDRELRNASCQRCASVKDTFERYKASYQQIIEKLETKISLLEGKVSTQEKELRGRNVSPVVNCTPQRASKSECRRQLLNCSVSPKLWDSILQEDSPRDTSCLVPPSPPTTTDEPAECEQVLEAAMCTAATNGKGKKLPPLAVQTVPETLEMELCGGSAENEIASYQAPLSAIAEKEEVSCEDFVQSRGNVAPAEVANDKRLIDCTKEQQKTSAEVPDSKSSVLVVIDEQEDGITDAESEGSPSLLQQDKVARPAPPCESWDDDVVSPTSVVSGTTSARSLSKVPGHQMLCVMDDGDKSPSLLDMFVAPKGTAAPVTSEAVKVAGPSSLPATEVTVSDDDLDPKSAQPSGSKLSLLRKRRASPTEAADVSMVRPPSRAKRKKQTKLSDRYFLSINRTTVPATRSSSRSTKKELSQTHVDTHFTEDSLFSMQRKHVDPDETFVSPGLLQDFKTPVLATVSGSPGALDNGSTTEVKQDSDNAGGNRAEEASSSSQEEPIKYHNSPVRKRADRQRLPAHDCKECQEFYGRLALPEAQRKDLLRKCSRHRAHYAPPSTPENFWELEFPDTQECRERGYLNATQKYVFGSKGLRKDGRR